MEAERSAASQADWTYRSLANLLQLDGTTLDELFEAWSANSASCGGWHENRTKEQIAELSSQIARMTNLLDDSRAFTAVEVRFHMLIAHATNNAVLRIYGNSLAELTFLQIQHVPFTRTAMEAGIIACRAILHSIEEGEGERTERRIALHLAAVEADIEKLGNRGWETSKLTLTSNSQRLTPSPQRMDHLTELAEHH